MDKKRKVTDLLEDAINTEDYKFRINLIVAGLMLDEPEADEENIKNSRQMLLEIATYCKKGNSERDKKDYLCKTAERIESYLGDCNGKIDI